MPDTVGKTSLKRIREPIQEDLILFQKEFERSLRSEVALINLVKKYILRHRGKQIRPMLGLLSARVCGEPTQATYLAASLIELIHLATLIHDDIVDGATVRRGWPTINRIWKNKISVLFGDYVLSKSLINMVRLKNFEALELISKTAEELSAGEILQMEKNIKQAINEDVYNRIIYLKTATLFSTTCELGALTTTSDSTRVKALSQYGKNLGMAFQIKDDLFDILGNESDTGKDLGADVKKNMKTLPLIHAVSDMDRRERADINSLLKKKRKSGKDLRMIQDRIRQKGGFQYAEDKVENYSGLAAEALSQFDDSPAKVSLLELVEFNKNRTW